MHLLYEFVSHLLFLLLFPISLVHPKLRSGLKARLGFYGHAGRREARPWPASRSVGPRVWFHGASAGDILAVFPMISELRSRCPEATIIVSVMTNSGFAMANDKLRGLVDGVTYVPYDLSGATRRALSVLKPDLLVLEYAELWPSLIESARRAGVKVALTNGRLSERLVSRYKLLHFLFGNPLAKLDLLLMRETVEAERALLLGAPKTRVRATGNTKFDHVSRPPDPNKVEELRELLHVDSATTLFVAGSTHEGEEQGLLESFLTLSKAHPGLRMVIAPRYVERASRIVLVARRLDVQVALRSSLSAGASSSADDDGASGRKAKVVIFDSIGELSALYSLATIVFVGGSFVSRGGQNILEPAGQGRPVLFGPYMMNFRDSVEVLLGRGGIQVQTVEQLTRVVTDLLNRPDEMARLGVMARAAVERVRGASARNAQLLLELLGACPSMVSTGSSAGAVGRGH